MTLLTCLQVASAGFAIVAGGLWFWSVRVKFPDHYNVHVVRPDMLPLGGDPMGGKYIGHAYSSDFNDLTLALRTQSRRNALAALAAGMSAVLQALCLFVVVN